MKGGCDYSALAQVDAQLQELLGGKLDAIIDEKSGEAAAALLSKLKKRTPVGKAPHFDEPMTVTMNGSDYTTQTTNKKGEQVFRKHKGKTYRLRSKSGSMDLSAFLAENAIPPEEEAAFVVSKRFLSDETDKKGNRKPLQWKLKAITGAEDESLRKSCVKRVPVPGRRNQYQQETDYNLYLGKLAVACTVYPNLNDKALQDSYKVMGAENLLKTMLTSGEYAEYLQKVQEVCGFDVPLQDEVDDAKN